jgi:hypothetical protein
MNDDETLGEFLQILGRIQELAAEAPNSDGEGLDLDYAIQQLRQSGNDNEADELARLRERAEELKAQHQTKS